MKYLLKDIKQCKVCEAHLPLGANPIVSFTPESKIILLSQAPGRIAHEKSKAWDDPSGKKLREWLGVTETQFYNPDNFAILPIGFCYPGKATTGDLPPRPECAPLWHDTILSTLKHVKLTILIGSYAQNYYLKGRMKRTLTETVSNFEDYLPKYFPIPHPSPTNRFWRAKNPWFEELVVPRLNRVIFDILQ
ncbi:uracil-DNA glycosylase family protein [Winogradskyella jejuensis]|uniref:Uracil-DNA glycosylase n=1 Tax=Winogradskyella jejuensis TaxID=1089305 RepID=A0A1M5N5L5_9FLAO|nr:uracil-DNA glycosylase family protein [Winogradskyella jejuensis]SHG84886.1 Uracil-DNA glycosylase [Winogradskyella jejuensis]